MCLRSPQEQEVVLNILKTAFKGFWKDECGLRAAALSYYTVFAMPPVLILLVTIVGRVWDPAEVQRALETQFAGIVGASGGQQIHQMIEHGVNSAGNGWIGTIGGLIGLLLGATGAFISLQDALNHVWQVRPDPKQGGLKSFIGKRILSLGIVLGLGFLLAVSLALSAGISALSDAVGGGIAPAVMYVAELTVSLAVLVVLFAALFKILPDAEVGWRDVWVGAVATALLFVIGKFAIGLYLGHSKPGDSFGAASALAVILVWVYYAGMILLFGAEFTQAWATERGRGARPEEGAVRVIEREIQIGVGRPGKRKEGATAAAIQRAPSPRGSGQFIDWMVGLPVLYLLFRQRAPRDPASSRRNAPSR
jgi:membrane protein